MNILGFIGNIFKPASDMVDNLHTSEEEKLNLRIQLQAIENQLAERVIDYEGKLMRAQADIITSEAQGMSWMQRNWRPLSMLTFLVLVVLDSFGLLVFRLSAEAWTLLQIGLGGYVIGRSAEKTVGEIIGKHKEK